MTAYDKKKDMDFLDAVLDSTAKLPRRFILCGESMLDEGQFSDILISEIVGLYGGRSLPHIGFENFVNADKYDTLTVIGIEEARLSDYRGGVVVNNRQMPVRFIPKGYYTINMAFTKPWANRSGFVTQRVVAKQNEGKVREIRLFEDDAYEKVTAAYSLLPPFNQMDIPIEFLIWTQTYLSVAFDVFYRWQVGVKKNGVEVCLPFLRQDIKEVYKLRDIPDGKKRRDALKTIVRRYKRTAKDTGDIMEVREHFRNSDSFTMDGERYTIYPCLDDVERITEGARYGQI
jgi:hypothetical protein